MGSDPFLFWRQYLRRPLGIGAVAPSSRSLARAMVAALDVHHGEIVVELGPGTGVFTRQLLDSGVARDKLILIEFDPGFATHLRQAFAGVNVIEGDASKLPDLLARLNHGKVRRVLSGLPFRSMPPKAQSDIAHAVSQSLEPQGMLVQFTYFNAPPLPAVADLEVSRAGRVLANLPPAHIWKYVKRAAPGAA